jgi:hypothetical protein
MSIMKLTHNIFVVTTSASLLALSAVLLAGENAQALPQGMTQSYVGGGVSVGALDDGQTLNAPAVGGNVQTRIAIPKTPVSLRGSAIFNDQAVALVPTVSFDIPVSDRANLYLGAGYSYVPNTGHTSPLGNQSTVVFNPGIEANVRNNMVVYSDAKIGLNGFKNDDATSMSVQFGAGYRF